VYAKNFLSDKIIEKQSEIVQDLNKTNLPVLKLIKGKNGKFVQHVKDLEGDIYQVTISKYVENVNTASPVITPELVKEMSSVLSKFHTKLKNYVETPLSERNLNYLDILDSLVTERSLKDVRGYLSRSIYWKDHADKYINDFYLKKAKELKTFFDKNQKRLLENTQLIHGVFSLGNLNVRNNVIHTVFDFDEMIMAPVNFEIACTIVHFDENYFYPEELFVQYNRKLVDYERMAKIST